MGKESGIMVQAWPVALLCAPVPCTSLIPNPLGHLKLSGWEKQPPGGRG